jgi:ribosomal protein S18 acetylase RimI-like enzyme
MSEVAITRGRDELLDAVRPLWLAMRDHHHAVAPQLGPIHGDEASWSRRRAQYEGWLAADAGAFVLLARDGAGTAVGYAVVRPDTWDSPTWTGPKRVADLESLSVSPAARGGGIGTALLARVRAEIEPEGYDHLMITAVAGNAGALRFYEREGLAVAFVQLMGSPRRP